MSKPQEITCDMMLNLLIKSLSTPAIEAEIAVIYKNLQVVLPSFVLPNPSFGSLTRTVTTNCEQNSFCIFCLTISIFFFSPGVQTYHLFISSWYERCKIHSKHLM